MARAGGARAGHGLVLVGTVGTALAQWLLVWCYARSGGPQRLGELTQVLAIATPVFVLAQMGLRNLYVTLRTDAAWSDYVRARLVGVAVGITVLVVAAAAVRIDSSLIAAMATLKAADSALDLFLARVHARAQFLLLGTLTLANPVLTVVAVLLVSFLGADPLLAVWGSALASALVALAAWLLAEVTNPRCTIGDGSVSCTGTIGDGSDSCTSDGWRRLMIAAAPITLARGLLSALLYVPVWLLSWVGDQAAVGVYATLSYLLMAGNLVGISLPTSLLPGYRREVVAGSLRTLVHRTVRRAGTLAAGGLVAAILTALLAPPLFTLIYGPEFVATAIEVLPVAIAGALMPSVYLLNGLLLAANGYARKGVVASCAVAGSLAAGALGLLLGLGPLTAAGVVALAGTLIRYGGTCRALLAPTTRELVHEEGSR